MTTSGSQPICWIIAGPNGAGKTTFALTYLPDVADCHRFINADSIAAGLSPLAPERERVSAGRLFLQEIRRHEQARLDFGFETTLSGLGHWQRIRRLRADGWRVELIYLALSDPATARQRVAERAAHGGHDIPVADIERRFERSLRNLFGYYVDAVDRTLCFVNETEVPETVFVKDASNWTVHRQDVLEGMRKWTNHD